MPRARSPNRDKAHELWKNSDHSRGAIKKIATELGVSEELVRKWKNQDGWDGKKKMVTLPNDAGGNSNVTNHRGGQPGNQNAKGHGAPKGNQNHYIHGLYANPCFDMMPAELKQRLVKMNYEQEEKALVEQLHILTFREYQLMSSIQKYEDKKNGIALDSVVRRTLEVSGNVIKGESQKQTETTTKTRDVFEVLKGLHAELTKVQKLKLQHIERLRAMRSDKLAQFNLEQSQLQNIDMTMFDEDTLRRLSELETIILSDEEAGANNTDLG